MSECLKGALRPSNAKRLYMYGRVKHGNKEIIEKANRKVKESKGEKKVKRKKRLCCYFV